jgi:hypothetical protein
MANFQRMQMAWSESGDCITTGFVAKPSKYL